MAKKSESNAEPKLRKSECPVPRGKLLLIGGKEDKGDDKEQGSAPDRNIDFIHFEILQRFVDELSGDKPMIVVIPTASEEPEEIIKDYRKAFKKLDFENLEFTDIRSREDASRPEFKDMIRRAAGIIFSGGDQLRLTAIFGGTEFLTILKERFTYDDVIIAGTSAGAMAMSTPMIYEGQSEGAYIKGDVRVATGMEFLKDVAIDTHFIKRGRIIRMTQALTTNPTCIGIGLEEDTAILVKNGRDCEVVGNGLITVVNPNFITDTNIHRVQEGQPVTVCGLRVDMLGDKDIFVIPVHDQMHI
jgi:cyanophycinase